MKFNSDVTEIYRNHYMCDADNLTNQRWSQEKEFHDEPEEPKRMHVE